MRVVGERLFRIFAVAVVASAGVTVAAAQDDSQRPVFRSSVDLVSVAAVVRDKQGRVMRSLTRDDFQLVDAGERRPLISFESDATAPMSVTFLVDGSGSMMGATNAIRHVLELFLGQLTPARDEAALMSFDTRLLTLRTHTKDLDFIRRGIGQIDAFGASSIYDAIAGTAGIVADRTGMRRAIVAITDGTDTASTYTSYQVASIASAIDVPVYVFAVGEDVTSGVASARRERAWAATTALAELAQSTGGELFYAGTRETQDAAVARVIDELRHQYLLAFEPSDAGGLRRIQVLTHNTALRVQARRWYATASSE